jgi:putative ATP-dependent endonuclease of OLD family
MKIQHVRIRRYRSLKDLSLDIDDYTVLVGPNGSGKSSVLYALDWFFNGGTLTEEDYHTSSHRDLPTGETNGDIDVEVTFVDLTNEDRAVLGQYGRSEIVRLRKTWSMETGKTKLLGNSKQGSGFKEIRDAAAADSRTLYTIARDRFPGLANATTKVEIVAQLDSWESDPANIELLEEIPASDATHMDGFNGPNKLSARVRFILVPASIDIVSQVQSAGKSSAVSQLIGVLMSDAVTTARAKWEAENADVLTGLNEKIKRDVEDSTKRKVDRVNSLLADLVPDASIQFETQIPAWSNKNDASVKTIVVINGQEQDVSRQGHGVQRAVMISMLQALIPDEESIRIELAEENPEIAETLLKAKLAELPALVICLEEPEIYQHPVRARHFANVLSQWAKRPTSQVVLATHSPYFLLPEQYESLRRFTLVDAMSVVTFSSVDDVATSAGVPPSKVRKFIEKEIPHAFSEGFFADAVVLVEGETDRVILEVVAGRIGKSLNALGVGVLVAGSKEGIKMPYNLLKCVGIPVYVLFDADAQSGSEARQSGTNDPQSSQEKATNDLLTWLPEPTKTLMGTSSFVWGNGTTITDHWGIFENKIEGELITWTNPEDVSGAQIIPFTSKDVAALRTAVTDAPIEYLPASLKCIVEAISIFVLQSKMQN